VVEQVLADPTLEDDVRFIGGVSAQPGDVGYAGLEGLEPGTYTLVCFVDEPEGVPHVVRGMVAEFTVRWAQRSAPDRAARDERGGRRA